MCCGFAWENDVRLTAPAIRLLFAAFVLTGCATRPPAIPEAPPAAPEQTETPAALPPPPVEIDRRSQRITIAAVGDMMIGTDYPDNRLPDDDGDSFLRAVTPVLAGADLAIGNLEGVLLDGGEPRKKCSNPSACYLFRSPTRYAQHFADAGFDLISLANNHARDFGELGRLSSMRSLAGVGIRHSGQTGDFASLIVSHPTGDIRVAFLAFAVTRNSNMLLNYELSERTIASYASDHDIVIVTFHGGAEGQDVTRLPFAEETYFGEPRGDVVRFSRMAVAAGADLVIGHGPHVVRAIERFDNRLIAYSLGNFATYYGISVGGIKGIAPILVVTLDGEGQFIEGHIHSTIQRRPAGPSIDPQDRALNLIRDLSIQDFTAPGIEFQRSGKFLPAPRNPRMSY